MMKSVCMLVSLRGNFDIKDHSYLIDRCLAYNITLSDISRKGAIMLKRNFRQPLRRIQAGNVAPALLRGNQLMASGRYVEAADVFEEFARGALARRGPRAPWLLLQAGQAHLMAGQVPAGMAHIQQGLGLFARNGQFRRLYHVGMRFVAELEGRGLAAESKQIEDYLKTALPAGFVPVPENSVEKTKAVLPTSCPVCGGPIRSNEIEWIDGLTAECPYCGSAVRAEG
jgi:hypothetical protein